MDRCPLIRGFVLATSIAKKLNVETLNFDNFIQYLAYKELMSDSGKMLFRMVFS